MAADSALAEILHDHYKDTFAIVCDRERQRNRLFLIVLALLGLLVLLLQSSATLHLAIPKINILGLTVKLSKLPLCVVISTSWVFLTALLLRYYQLTLHVYKQYDYVHCLEERLSEALGSRDIITREGKAYLANKGHYFRHWTWRFYTLCFPLIRSLPLFCGRCSWSGVHPSPCSTVYLIGDGNTTCYSCCSLSR